MPPLDIDPYQASGGLFERTDCGHREEATTHPGSCPECEGPVQNIAISRE